VKNSQARTGHQRGMGEAEERGGETAQMQMPRPSGVLIVRMIGEQSDGRGCSRRRP